MTEHHAPGGSDLGDEARKLAEAVQQWAKRTMPAPPGGGHSGPECQWCPLCQFASLLRGEHPELAERVTEAGTALAGAVKALVEAASAHVPAQHAEDAAEPSSTATDHGSSGTDAPRVQRISIDEPPEEA